MSCCVLCDGHRIHVLLLFYKAVGADCDKSILGLSSRDSHPVISDAVRIVLILGRTKYILLPQ